MKQFQIRALPKLPLNHPPIMRHTAISHKPEFGRPTKAAGRNCLAIVGGQFLLAFLLLTKSLAAAPLTITTQTLSNAMVGTAFSQTLAATGGTPPYTGPYNQAGCRAC